MDLPDYPQGKPELVAVNTSSHRARSWDDANMQAMLLPGSNEQFDITDAEAVNAIYNHIDNAVESIKVSFVMTRAK